MILIKNVSAILDKETYRDSVNIVIKDSNIAFVGDNPPYSEYSHIIDGSSYIALPGFVNTHSHLAMTLMRGLGEDLPLKDWLDKVIFPLESKLTYDVVYFASLLAAIESIKTGTTTTADFYFYPNATLKALSEIGMRANIGIAYASKPFMDNTIIKNVETKFKELVDKDSKILISLAPHAPYTVSQELFKLTLNLSKKLNIKIQVHLHETEQEVLDYLKTYTKTPIEFLASIGFLDENVIAAHCVWVSEKDIKLLKRRNVWVSLNPESNLKLGSFIPPINKFVEDGLRLTVGTDGVASNNNLSVLESIRLTSMLAKGISRNPKLLTANEAFEILTYNGAQALGFENVGKIKKGFKADIILVDKNTVNFIPNHSPISNVIYSMYPTDVDTVIIGGEIVMQNKKILTIEEEIVKEEFKKIFKSFFD
ncbi:MAG: amidohydrolase [Caldisericaceae bacterium]